MDVCVVCNCYFFDISRHPHTLIDSHGTHRREEYSLKDLKHGQNMIKIRLKYD
jgi:hypothetical protein